MENQPTQGEWYVNEQLPTTIYSNINGFTKIADVNDFKNCSRDLRKEAETNAKLMAASKYLLKDASDSQIMIWLLCHGGAFVSKTSMYDEDGVEGWKWEYNGREFYEVGNWSDNPPLPEDLKRLVMVSTDAWKSETIKKLTK